VQLISSTKVVGADENNGFGGRVGGSFWGKGGVYVHKQGNDFLRKQRVEDYSVAVVYIKAAMWKRF